MNTATDNSPQRMAALISIGLLSGLFFSSTFILNRLMSLEGGHWVWSASLRYAYMILFLLGWTTLSRGPAVSLQLLRYFGELVDRETADSPTTHQVGLSLQRGKPPSSPH